MPNDCQPAALSYVHGVSDVQLRGETIGAALDRAADIWADRDALVVCHQDIRWSYAELRERADRVASGLLALGLRPGDRLGIWSPNNAEWLLTQYAAAKAGVILVTINPAYRAAEVEYVLNLSQCRGLVLARSFKSSDYVGMMRSLLPELVDGAWPADSARLPHLKIAILVSDTSEPGFLPFDEVALAATAETDEQVRALAPTLQCDDPINIQFTSGTTGSPKGATLSHHNILNNAFYLTDGLRLTEADRLCLPVPLYHCFGMVAGNLGCLVHGAAVIYPGEGFDPGAVLAAVEAERCTALFGVPTMFIAELDHPDFASFDLKTLRTGIMGGSPCPIEIVKRVVDRMHMRDLAIAYGMTETSPGTFLSRLDDPLERRATTIGRVLPHVEAKVVDLDGKMVAAGDKGELCIRGYVVMLGYWDDDAKTRETIDSARWLHTGDLAMIDAEGYCAIVGRIKDMVIRGGENLYPREIEDFLFQHPRVQTVQVVGVPDDKFGEELCAWIRLTDGETLVEEEIRAFCRGRIAHQKIPRYIRFVDSFPMTVTGKIQKFLIRRHMIEELGLRG